MVDILSIASGVVSIVLAIYAIWFAKKESAQSADNYNKTKELLKDIEHKSELIDRGIQFQQQYLLDIINQMLNKAGKESVDMKPLSLNEINEIVDGKTAEAKKRIAQLEDTVNKVPHIYVGKEEPKNMNNGDIWFQIE